jgi:hypothetical protein
MKLLTDSAGQDPKLVYKLTQMIQNGLVVEDSSSNNVLNYREMTSKDDIGAVYREHMPRIYNLVLAVIRAHNAKEKMCKIEREHRGALWNFSPLCPARTRARLFATPRGTPGKPVGSVVSFPLPVSPFETQFLQLAHRSRKMVPAMFSALDCDALAINS